ncbi:hypothetical protein [Paraglaciecola sp. L1A13]|uniref:hypothetical protein n=1 Tax=Paraglaciecola sp. L1A13 TaxID=2686359 RepID=UPI001E3591BD|nr:hypothetical protein [Paraglaciecola sp. L1A13]
MYKSLIFILCLYAAQSFAQCDVSSSTLSASYQLESTNGLHQHASDLVLWRNGRTVAHQYLQTHITESWYLSSNQQIKPTRYFDTQQRAIEYQPGEKVHGKAESDWDYRNQLISNSLLSQLDIIKETGTGCERTQFYSKTIGGTQINVKWLVGQALPSYYSWTKGAKHETWTLQKVNHDDKQISDFFAHLGNYQTTDFADIGDDHSDPFLNKMVTLGFIEKGASGFYDDQGNALDGGHHHE